MSRLWTGDTINNGQSDLPFMKLTPIGVTADNIAETVIADGFRTGRDLRVNSSSTARKVAVNHIAHPGGNEPTAAAGGRSAESPPWHLRQNELGMSPT
ncbi:MAG: hypothetical protein R2838_24680 [Caldilineaceae bacterium]